MQEKILMFPLTNKLHYIFQKFSVFLTTLLTGSFFCILLQSPDSPKQNVRMLHFINLVAYWFFIYKIANCLFRRFHHILKLIDLIERKRRGLGRPSLIYVKDFSSGLPKAQVQNCPNSNSCAAESAILVQPKPQANKTDKNKTEWNDPDPIYSVGIREQLEDYFYQVLEVDLLLRLCPDDEDTIYQIVDLLVDTCSTKRKMLRIAGDDKPTEVVRSRLKKLNADHIRFVLDSLAENTAPVRNMKQYLLAMLYNAPTTMNLYYQNKTNHDFARGSPKAG